MTQPKEPPLYTVPFDLQDPPDLSRIEWRETPVKCLVRPMHGAAGFAVKIDKVVDEIKNPSKGVFSIKPAKGIIEGFSHVTFTVDVDSEKTKAYLKRENRPFLIEVKVEVDPLNMGLLSGALPPLIAAAVNKATKKPQVIGKTRIGIEFPPPLIWIPDAPEPLVEPRKAIINSADGNGTRCNVNLLQYNKQAEKYKAEDEELEVVSTKNEHKVSFETAQIDASGFFLKTKRVIVGNRLIDATDSLEEAGEIAISRKKQNKPPAGNQPMKVLVDYKTSSSATISVQVFVKGQEAPVGSYEDLTVNGERVRITCPKLPPDIEGTIRWTIKDGPGRMSEAGSGFIPRGQQQQTRLTGVTNEGKACSGARIEIVTIPLTDADPIVLNVPAPAKPITSLRIVSLTFKSDHRMSDSRMLKKQDSGGEKRWEWTDTLPIFQEPDWTNPAGESNPITHSKETKVSVDLEITAEPADASPSTGRLTGEATFITVGGGGPAMKNPLIFEKDITITPGKPLFIKGLETKGSLPNKLTILDRGYIKWRYESQEPKFEISIGRTGPHKIYVTFGTPVISSSANRAPEDGVTVKRMAKALELMARIPTLVPHDVVIGLMREYLPQYTTIPDPRGAPHHPAYRANAWFIADDLHLRIKAECQAICRFVGGVLHQLGIPGTIEPVIIWADPEYNGGREALEAPLTWRSVLGKEPPKDIHGRYSLYRWWRPAAITAAPEGQIPAVGLRQHIVQGIRWYPILITRVVSKSDEGKLFTAQELGPNMYEACLKFTHGATKYYGGGLAGIARDKKEEILKAFQALVWLSQELVPVEVNPGIVRNLLGYRLQQVIATNKDW